MREAHEDFYQGLRKRLATWVRSKGSNYRYADYVLLAPDLFHLLARLVVDKRVPAAKKVKLAAALAYFVSPVDLIPEAVLGPVGFVDDIALAVYVLNDIVNSESGYVAEELWAGDTDLLETLRWTSSIAQSVLGTGIWGRLKSLVRPKWGR